MDASSSKIGNDTTSVASSNQTISTNYKVMSSENDPFDKAKTNPILVMAYPEYFIRTPMIKPSEKLWVSR